MKDSYDTDMTKYQRGLLRKKKKVMKPKYLRLPMVQAFILECRPTIHGGELSKKDCLRLASWLTKAASWLEEKK